MQEEFEQLMELYHSIKEEVRRRDKHLYERWKAGGFCIDKDVMSMYPNLSEVMASFDEPEDEEEPEDDEE